jgi:hypothetical protein
VESLHKGAPGLWKGEGALSSFAYDAGTLIPRAGSIPANNQTDPTTDFRHKESPAWAGLSGPTKMWDRQNPRGHNLQIRMLQTRTGAGFVDPKNGRGTWGLRGMPIQGVRPGNAPAGRTFRSRCK